MAERKSLSKKTRFEVFKRDSFTCQYCGKKSPDVILEVDHIKPIKHGGENDMLNLITSCFECNRGKSKRKISDNSVVEKQRAQIEELNLRRQQLEMMLEWRNAVSTIKDDSYKKVIEYWEEKTNSELSETGIFDIKKLVDRFGVINVLDSIDIAIDSYFDKFEINIVFNKLGGICFVKNSPEHKQKMSYIKGICRYKFRYYNIRQLSIMLNKYYDNGYDLDVIIENLKNGNFNNYTKLITFIESTYE